MVIHGGVNPNRRTSRVQAATAKSDIRDGEKQKQQRTCNMISIYDTVVIPLIVCSCVSVFLAGVYNDYWKNHKISIFGAMGAATFTWVTYINDVLPITVSFVSGILIGTIIGTCDMLYLFKKEERKKVAAYKEWS